jgi:hypothetical protein
MLQQDSFPTLRRVDRAHHHDVAAGRGAALPLTVRLRWDAAAQAAEAVLPG